MHDVDDDDEDDAKLNALATDNTFTLTSIHPHRHTHAHHQLICYTCTVVCFFLFVVCAYVFKAECTFSFSHADRGLRTIHSANCSAAVVRTAHTHTHTHATYTRTHSLARWSQETVRAQRDACCECTHKSFHWGHWAHSVSVCVILCCIPRIHLCVCMREYVVYIFVLRDRDILQNGVSQFGRSSDWIIHIVHSRLSVSQAKRDICIYIIITK